MVEKLIRTSKYAVNGAVGFITHEDQEVHGLSFNVEFDVEGTYYTRVNGDEGNIENWRARVEGEYITEEELEANRPLPHPLDEEV